ncbi:MAG: response regulator [Gemmatimonadaceae bacterium]
MRLALTKGVPTTLSPSLILVATLKPSLVQLLRDAGFDVAVATSGGELCRIASTTSPDVAILDNLLEDMSGTEACRLLRADPAVSRQLPILIVVDGIASPELRVAAIHVGVWDFLDRTARADEIVQKISAHIQSRREFAELASDEFADAVSGLRSRLGLARRIRELASLMMRMHSGLCCVVIETEAKLRVIDLDRVVARAARLSDVVGQVGEFRTGVVGPSTGSDGAVRLATRIVSAVAAAAREHGIVPAGGSPADFVTVGYDAVSNAAYAPFDPMVMLRNASIAVASGDRHATLPWLRRFSPEPHDESASTPLKSHPTGSPDSHWSHS